MAESPAGEGTATYYANIVSTNVFPDEVVMEFRRFVRPHKEVFEKFGKALKEYLDKTIPVVEAQRKP